MSGNKESEMLIVGAGPVGLTCACILHYNGFKPIIIDENETINIKAKRAIGISHASMSIFHALGLSTILEKMVCKTPNINIYYNNKRFAKLNYRDLPIKHQYFTHLYQPDLESILSNYLYDNGIIINRGIKFINLSRTQHDIELCVVDQLSKMKSYTTKYLLACDGGQSSVRECLNINMISQNYGCGFILADIELIWDQRKKEIQYYTYSYGYLMIIPASSGFSRVIASLQTTIVPIQKQVIIEKLSVLCKEAINFPPEFKQVIWTASSGFGHKVACVDAIDNVFLVGDAYHQFSPVGGINMNFGIQDALNIACKLSRVLKQTSPKKLLSYYYLERYENIQKTINSSKAITYIMTGLEADNEVLSNDMSQFISRLRPSMKNRVHLKYNIPSKMLGYSSYQCGEFENSKHCMMIGRNALEIGLIDNLNIRDFYVVGSNNLPLSFQNWISSNKLDIKLLINNNHCCSNHVYLIRPDGGILMTTTYRYFMQAISNYEFINMNG